MNTFKPDNLQFSKPKYKGPKRIVVLWILLVFIAVTLCALFVNNIKQLLLQNATENLSEVSLQAAIAMDERFKGRLYALEALATLKEITDPAESIEKKLSIIDHEADIKHFFEIGIANDKGTSLNNDGVSAYIGDRDYFIKAMNGTPNVSDRLIARVETHPNVVIYAVPIISDGKAIGVLFAADRTEEISYLIEHIYYSGKANAFILDSKGNVIAHDKNAEMQNSSNFLDIISKETSKENLEQIENDFTSKLSGTGSYTYNGSVKYAGYTPMESTSGWYFLVSAPSEVILKQVNKIIAITFALIFLLIVYIIGLFIYSSFHRKRYTDQLKLSEERYRIISELTEDMILDWNLTTGEIYCSPNWEERLGPHPTKTSNGSLGSLDPNIGLFHSEDFYLVFEMIKKLQRGEEVPQFDFRAKTVSGNFVWLRAITTVIFDISNKPIRAICVFLDVTDIKNKEQSLINEAKYDFLTKVYSRAAFEERATVEIELAKEHGTELAFMFVDIDDFKNFNSKYGHAFGDRVLSFIGGKIMQAIDSIGFAGRNGGDEFIVCITDKQSIASINIVAQKLISELSEGLKARETDNIIAVSCSIGVVIYPNAGDTYHELISKADFTMYQVKNTGKGNYRIFDYLN